MARGAGSMNLLLGDINRDGDRDSVGEPEGTVVTVRSAGSWELLLWVPSMRSARL